jgi:predicted dienelactone hydrolase
MLLAVMAPSTAATQVPVAPDQPEFVLPHPQGPHLVGVRSFSWIDDQNPAARTASGALGREVSVQIWYPATGSSASRPALYSPGLELILAAAADLSESDRGFIMAHQPLLHTATNSLPGAEMLYRDRAWPVVLFSPGGNVSRHWQTVLAEGMASRGFVFVAMTHPFSTIDVAPASGFSMSIDWGLDQEDEQAAAEADNRLADVLARDAAFVLERLRDLARTGTSFAGALDLDEVGIAGHSRGGKTVGRTCASHPAFKACAVIDNIGPARERTTGIQPPLLTLRSPWDNERVAKLHDYLGRTGSVAYDVAMIDSNHFTCADLPLFIPDLRAEGVDPADGIENCARILTGFFDAHLVRRLPSDERWVPPVHPDLVEVRRF